MGDMEDLTIILIASIQPERSSLTEEFFLEFNIPVLVLSVEFEVVSCAHTVDIQEAIFSLHGHILEGSHRRRNSLF
jgi:hypothetical protein